MPEVTIKAEPRNEFGKGAARRIRRTGLVPAVLYGHGEPPVHIALPGHELMLALKDSNVLLDVMVDGKSQLALPKQVQRDTIRGFLKHVDLVTVRRGEKVVVDVGVTHVGEADPEALVVMEHPSVTIEAEATHIPSEIEVSLDGLTVGDQILAKDLPLPTGVSLQIDPETLIINVSHAPTAEQVEAEISEAEAEAGVEHEAPEVESATEEAGGESSESGESSGQE